MTTRAIRIQHGIAAYNALPNDASVEDRIGAAMDVAREEVLEEAAQIAEDRRPGHGDTEEALIEESVSVDIMEAIRALSSAPPPVTVQPRSEEEGGEDRADVVRLGRKDWTEWQHDDARLLIEICERLLATPSPKPEDALREALEYIAEGIDAGRHDGLPEECPAHDADTMFAIARAALAKEGK